MIKSSKPGVIVVTPGSYCDIDGLACSVALSEFLGGIALIPKHFDITVPPSIQKWPYAAQYDPPKEISGFVIVDGSNPNDIQSFIKEEDVLAVYDHRFAGFENYWGEKGCVEAVGACATLIHEVIKESGKTPSALAANLLYTGILSNTLYFKGNVTTRRDLKAAEELKSYTTLPADWAAHYYTEIDTPLLVSVEDALARDTLSLDVPKIIFQLEVWDGYKLFRSPEFVARVRKYISSHTKKPWLLMMPSISNAATYFITDDKDFQKGLTDHFNASFNQNGEGQTEHLFQRKEIIKVIK